MSYIGTDDFGLEVAKGNVAGHTAVNKFGQALDCDSGVPTDIWDGADGTTSTDLWVPPTTARSHNLASTSANDDGTGFPLSGLRSVRVYGLTSWGASEVTEDVTLNGTANVATSASFVIIYRMRGLTWGTSPSNEGIVTATAATDATVTAAIQTGNNQTLMAIYAVPNTQKLYITRMYATVQRQTAASVDISLLVNDSALVETSENLGWRVRQKLSASNDGPLDRYFNPPLQVDGSAFVKMQANSSANNTVVSGAFDGFLVDD